MATLVPPSFGENQLIFPRSSPSISVLMILVPRPVPIESFFSPTPLSSTSIESALAVLLVLRLRISQVVRATLLLWRPLQVARLIVGWGRV